MKKSLIFYKNIENNEKNLNMAKIFFESVLTNRIYVL